MIKATLKHLEEQPFIPEYAAEKEILLQRRNHGIEKLESIAFMLLWDVVALRDEIRILRMIDKNRSTPSLTSHAHRLDQLIGNARRPAGVFYSEDQIIDTTSDDSTPSPPEPSSNTSREHKRRLKFAHKSSSERRK
jgi:hypothetical protein